MSRKVLVSGFFFGHMTKYGGYDKIGKNPNVSYIYSNISSICFLPKLIKYRLINKCLNFIGLIAFFLLDIRARVLLAIKYDILHYVYTEDQYFFPRIFKNNKKVIGTVHLDPIFIENYHSLGRNKNYLRFIHNFDLLITLNSEMAILFNTRYGVKTKFIPHGFSKPSFMRIPYCDRDGKIIDKSNINIFFSGTNYRDYDTLMYIIENTCNKNVYFHIMGQSNTNKKREKRLDNRHINVSVYNRLNDDAYYSVLNDCDYNFLPVTFATANNVLLEAQSFGLVSILPNINGICDYAAPNPLNMFYNDKHDALKIFNTLQKAEHDHRIIDFSHQFNWENIYKRLDEVYNSL
jgi:glycosyltransferase involved in cell wall biosynthesis